MPLLSTPTGTTETFSPVPNFLGYVIQRCRQRSSELPPGADRPLGCMHVAIEGIRQAADEEGATRCCQDGEPRTRPPQPQPMTPPTWGSFGALSTLAAIAGEGALPHPEFSPLQAQTRRRYRRLLLAAAGADVRASLAIGYRPFGQWSRKRVWARPPTYDHRTRRRSTRLVGATDATAGPVGQGT